MYNRYETTEEGLRMYRYGTTEVYVGGLTCINSAKIVNEEALYFLSTVYLNGLICTYINSAKVVNKESL